MMHSKKDVSVLPGRLFLRPWIGPYVASSQGWRCDACPWMGGIPQRLGMAVLLFCITASPAAWSETDCPATLYDETTTIKYVHDGDTLHLKDGRKVRLIGINTPEVAHADSSAEAYSAEAKKALKTAFKENREISLVYGKEKQDRYNRLLAHAFSADGDNIQAMLLTRGFARAITFPPNSRFSACYQQQERKARCAKTGLWKKQKPLAAKNLDNSDIGFQLVKGKLKNIDINKKGIWLTLDNKLSVGIRPDNQPLFEINAIYELLDKDIVVRGWLNKSKKGLPYYMRVRHPTSIQSAAAFACS